MTDVYTTPPVLENDRYRLRLVSREDCADLLRVYSDEKAVPFFNSDNCGGDDFHYTTEERMMQAIDFWLREYGCRYYIRWSILDKRERCAVGTVELFNRQAEDAFTDCGLLRLDLRSDHETREEISCLLSLIIPPMYDLFGCEKAATKAVPAAKERIVALTAYGFTPSSDKLIGGHDGAEYGDYYVIYK